MGGSRCLKRIRRGRIGIFKFDLASECIYFVKVCGEMEIDVGRETGYGG